MAAAFWRQWPRQGWDFAEFTRSSIRRQSTACLRTVPALAIPSSCSCRTMANRYSSKKVDFRWAAEKTGRIFKAKPAGVPETGNIEILSRLKMNKDRVREEQKRWSEDNAPDGAVRPMKDTKAETEIPTGKRPPEHPRRVNETADNKSTNDNSYTSRLLDAKRRAHDGDKR